MKIFASLRTRLTTYQELTHRFSKLLTRSGWWLITLLNLLIGYLCVAQRGMYYDDYFQKYVGFTTFPARPLSQILSIVLLKPDWATFEVWVRLLFAGLVGVNALLVGYFVYRLVSSRFAAVLSVWLFLMPVAAYEATLWQAAATLYLPGTLLTLLCWLSYYNALHSKSRSAFWIAVSLVCCVITVLFTESLIFATLLFLPFLAFLAHNRSDASKLPIRRTVYLTAALVIPSLLISGLLYIELYKNNLIMQEQFQYVRGNITFDPALLITRMGQYWQSFQLLTIAPDWGSQLIRSSFTIGMITLIDHPKAFVLLTVAVALMFIVAIFWHDNPSTTSSLRRITALLIGSAVWFAASLFLPGILVSRQSLESRVLYFPLAGISVFTAVFCLLLVQLLRRNLLMNLFVLTAGVVLIAGTICTVGYTRLFAERSTLDLAQVEAIHTIIPHLEATDTIYFVPYQFDERIFGTQSGFSQAVWGAFELYGSGRVLLRNIYHTNNIDVIEGSRWVIPQMDNAPEHGVAAGQIKIQDRIVPIDHVILLTYRDGKAYIIDHLASTDSSGKVEIITFPMSQQLTSTGATSIDTVQAPS